MTTEKIGLERDRERFLTPSRPESRQNNNADSQ
jgi:hypothetical protein